MNILIVEDEKPISDLLDMSLTDAGYHLSLIHIYGSYYATSAAGSGNWPLLSTAGLEFLWA